MPAVFEKWFQSAARDLDAAHILFQNKNYPQTVFFLQQADEKASKGLLMRSGFLPTCEETEEIKETRRIVGVPSSTPKDYGHAWHKKMLHVLRDFIDTLDNMTRDMVETRFPEPRMIRDISKFRENIPDWKRRISRAGETKINPNPSLQELDDAIRYCNELLDSSLSIENRVRTAAQNIRLPNKKLVLKKLGKRLKVKNLDKESLETIDKIYSKNPVEYTKNLVIPLMTLIVLAILNTYLLPHEWTSRYPDADAGFAYDENLSIVKRFNGLMDLLKRCLTFAAKPN